MNNINSSILERRLLAASASIEVPDASHLAVAVLRRLPLAQTNPRASSRMRDWVSRVADVANARRRLSIAFIAAAMASTVLAVPPARAAVADWFGIGGVRIEKVDVLVPPDPASATTGTTGTAVPGSVSTTAADIVAATTNRLLATLGLREVTSIDEAASIVGFVPQTFADSELGPPDVIAAGSADGVEQIATLWLASQDRPPSTGWPEVVVLHTEFIGLGEITYLKTLPAGAKFERVELANTSAYWISGAGHSIERFNADGTRSTETWRLAGDTLVWAAGGHTHRLESTLGLEATIALANSLR